MKKENMLWKIAPILLVPLLVFVISGCGQNGASAGTVATITKGLQSDSNVYMAWPSAPQQARIVYYNTFNLQSSWIESSSGIKFGFPRAIALNTNSSKLYITDQYGIISMDTATGKIAKFATDPLHKIGSAYGITVDSNGLVYTVDKAQKKVVVYNQDNQFVREFDGNGLFQNPISITFDKNTSHLYVSDTKADTVTAWTLDGGFLFTFEDPAQNQMSIPLQVAVNSQGVVYVVHMGIKKIMVYDGNGKYQRGYVSEGTAPGQLLRPKGIAIDSDDNVYVTDAAFDNFQIWTSQDKLALWVGKAGGEVGQFNMPKMIAIDGQNRVYVVDYGNSRVQIFQYLKK